MLKPYKTLSSKKIVDNPFIRLFEEEFIAGNGEKGKYYLYSYTNDVTQALGIDKKKENFILSREYRYPIQMEVVQVCGGVNKDGEDPKMTAERELFEETGYRGSKVVDLGKVAVDPAKSKNWLYEFLILDCKKVENPHGGEKVEETEPFLLPVNDTLDWIRSGKIVGPHSISTLMKGLIWLGEV